jgi:hypothetical protein
VPNGRVDSNIKGSAPPKRMSFMLARTGNGTR